MRFFRSVGVLLVIILAFTAFSAFDCGDSSPWLSISINPFSAFNLTLDPPDGNTTQLFTASGIKDDGGPSEVATDDVDWESQDSAVAFFVDNVLHPAGVGSTQVRGTVEGGDVVSSWVAVTVKPPFAVLGGTLSANDDTLDIGDSTLLTMMASIDNDLDGTEDATENVTGMTNWVVSGTGDGTMNGNEFTADEAGDVTITGSFESDDVALSSLMSDSVTITVLPPVGVALTLGSSAPTFTGTGNTTVNLTAVPNGGTPDGYTWTATGGGNLGSADTGADPTNTLEINWNDAGATITVEVTADFQGVDVDDSDQLTVAAAQGPSIDSLTVGGSAVGDGQSAGSFGAGDSLAVVVTGSDPDGGTVSYAWSATNGGSVTPTGASVTASQSTPDATTVVTVTATDDNGGGSAQRTFSFDVTLAAPEMDELRLRSITPGGAGQIRLLCETGDMTLPRLGISVEINYDGSKLSAGGGDGHADSGNPFSPGLELFFPNLNPANMTAAAFAGTTTGGPVFYIDFTVDSGSGDVTDFTFVQANSLYSAENGTDSFPADVYTDAMGVAVP